MTTEADSSSSSLSTAPTIGQISPIKPEIYYNKATRDCWKKCPCRVWTQCRHYVDVTDQQSRLKYKNNRVFEEINKWYEENFRVKYEYSDIFGNG
jgi:hypothetical protein